VKQNKDGKQEDKDKFEDTQQETLEERENDSN